MFKNNIKIISIIIGTLIGAGFASGKEIYTFFVKYNSLGFFSVIFSCFFIGLIINKTLLLILNNNINNYSDFLNLLFGENKFKKIFYFFINLFLLLSYITMISGFNSFFKQELNIPKIITCIFICLFCFFIFRKNISSILNINSILIPFLIFIIFLFGFLYIHKLNINLFFCNIFYFNNSFFECFLNSILYASYNCIILIPILISLKKYLENKRQIKYISFFSFIFLCSLTLIIFLFIFYLPNNYLYEIPIIVILNKFSNIQKNIYGIVIAIAILTSVISSGFGFIDNLKNKNNFIIFLISFLPIFFINISFSFLVNFVFSFFGYIGLVQIIFILLKKTHFNVIKVYRKIGISYNKILIIRRKKWNFITNHLLKELIEKI